MFDSRNPSDPSGSAPVSLEEQRNVLAEGLDPRARRFLNAWLAARTAAAGVPMRQAFDPMAVPTLLSAVSLYRWDPARDDFICKLAGETTRGAWGRGIRGLPLAEVVGADHHPTIKQRWLTILAGPMVHRGWVERERDGSLSRADRLILPLRDGEDGPVDHILCLSLYRFDGPGQAQPPLVPDRVTQIPCAAFDGIQSV
jgi:hypothetical protein